MSPQAITKKKRRVVFLDRDGTIIHDRPGYYLRRPEKLKFYKVTFEALRLLKRAGYQLVLVTNQSGIGRGYLDTRTLAKIHRRLQANLRRRGTRIDAIYFCPHHPKDGCRCRKPSPFMARRAVREMGLTLEDAVIVGDKKADIDLGRALGISSVLLRTGHGRDQRKRFGRKLKATYSAKDILTAARWIIRRRA
ncbi:MAG: HAD family hydrolase [Elusimicrobiota bacterium]